MNSIWKDLLFLHGHLLHKEDLEWQADSTPEQRPAASADSSPQPAPTRTSQACNDVACA